MIDELGIVEFFDERILKYPDEKVTSGEVVKAIILISALFQSPCHFVLIFFEDIPLDLYFSREIEAESFNRYKIDRVLDDVFEHGAESIFVELVAVA